MLDVNSKSNNAAQEAFNMIEALKDKLYNKNRFFCTSDPVLDILYTTIPTDKPKIPTGTILYRARVMPNLDPASWYYLQELRKYKHEAMKPFKGYNAEESMQPMPNKMRNGRTNPSLMACLYTARDFRTAIYEVKPKTEDIVSVAKIKTLTDINVIDLSVLSLAKDISEQDEVSQWILSFIVGEFLAVCQDSEKDYIFTQYISDFYKTQGFTAIEFSSSLDKSGKNVTIFKPENCEAISSDIYKIDTINLSFSRIE